MSMEAMNAAFSASNSALYSAQIAQLQNQTQQQLMNINTEMQSTAQKGEMQRFQIMYDTQTKVMEMQQDMTLNRAKSQDKMFGKWDEFVKQ
ncbi:hypothetical protein IJT10_03790 [bacterium]|nr:hypothetical protein [bacterium]